MITWGVGSIPFNVQAKVECNENLAIIIQAIRAKYAKVFKGAWMEHDWISASIRQCGIKRLTFLCNIMILK
jgi:hypothetical protein